jgi:hypothetical protein
MVANCKLNYSQKTGVASAFGNNHLDNSATAGKSIVYGASAKLTIWLVLFCILSNCENLFPLGLAPLFVSNSRLNLEQMFAFSTTGVNS